VPFLAVAGAGWLASFNATFAAMQMLVSDEMRGRVMAVCNTAVYGVMAFSPLLADATHHALTPAAGDEAAIRISLAIFGAVMAVVGVVMLVWRTPEVDGIAPGQPGFERKPGLWRGITGEVHRPPEH
jgi:predicted membrane channel-forming protein YqfA (hemolysin III family)